MNPGPATAPLSLARGTRLAALGAPLLVLLVACSGGPVASSGPATTTSSAAASVPPASAVASPTGRASVVVSKGAPAREENCTHSSCAFIVITTANFAGDVTCRLDGGWAGPWALGPNETRATNAYWGYPNKTVTITCADGGQTASGSLRW